MARALRCDHEDIEVRTRIDEAEVDVEAVCESDGGALAHVFLQILIIDVGLAFIRGQHHDDIGPLGGFRCSHAFQTGGFDLGTAGRVFTQRDDDVLHATVFQIIGVGMALAAVTDNRNLLVLDQIDVGIPIVIDAHF